MTSEIPPDQLSRDVYQLHQELVRLRAQLDQKMHMDRAAGGIDEGDQYYFQGLGYIERLATITLSLIEYSKNTRSESRNWFGQFKSNPMQFIGFLLLLSLSLSLPAAMLGPIGLKVLERLIFGK